MDGAQTRSAGRGTDPAGALRVAQVESTAEDPIAAIAAQLGGGPFGLVCLFASPEADFIALNDAAIGAFGGADVFACTTAGEIGRAGYEEGQIIAIAFPSALFAVDALAIDGLDALDDNGMGVIVTATSDAAVSDCVVRMIAAGLFDRCPGLRIVIRSGGS